MDRIGKSRDVGKVRQPRQTPEVFSVSIIFINSLYREGSSNYTSSFVSQGYPMPFSHYIEPCPYVAPLSKPQYAERGLL